MRADERNGRQGGKTAAEAEFEIPMLPDIDRLESLASAETATREGAWWITFQVVEHLFNTISATDKVNHQFLPDFLSQLIENYEAHLREEAVRPIPNDRLQQLVGYVSHAAAYILRQPRTSLVKEEARVRPHELREMRSRTMNWIARQPGGTLKHKLAGNKRMAALVNEFTCDTKENRVAAHVLGKLGKRVQDRLAHLKGAYDNNASDIARTEELERFVQLQRRKKSSPLADVMPKDELVPNNVLLNDKHYSVVWRTNQLLKVYERHIADHWNTVFERYVRAMYWAVAAKVRSVSGAALIDELATVFDEGGVIGIRFVGAGAMQQQAPDADIRLVRMASRPLSAVYQRGIVKFYNSEKRFGFIEGQRDVGKVFFHASAVKGLPEVTGAGEDEVQLYQEVLYLAHEGKRGLSADTVLIGDRFASIDVRLNGQRIIIDSAVQAADGAGFRTIERRQLAYVFTPDVDGAPIPGRGVRFGVSHGDGRTYAVNLYSDMEAIRELAGRIAEDVASACGLRDVVACLANTGMETDAELLQAVPNVTSGGLAFDFTSYQPFLWADGMQQSLRDRHLYAAVIAGMAGTELPRRGHLFATAADIVALNGILSGDDRIALVNSAFSQSLDRIRDEIGMPDAGYFVYTVPDSVDAFAQRTKAYMNAVSRRSYPVWRSIAAAMAWKDSGATRLADRWNVLVIDTHEASSNAVLLKAKTHEKLQDLIFEHYAPFSVSDEDFEINYDFIERTYLQLFAAKYGLNLDETDIRHLIHSGSVYRAIMMMKESSVQYVVDSNGEPVWYSLFFDEEVYGRTMEQWALHFEHYASMLARIPELPARVHAVLVLGDHLSERPGWTDKLYSLPGCEEVKLVTTNEVLAGALAINDRLIRDLPTWYEYLPDLSLEVVKDGRYDELVLIKDESISTMGEVKIIQVQDNLILEGGHTNYRFPLHIGSAGRGSEDNLAVIEHESFPLKSSLPVHLTIRYRYGVENSYELIVTPVERECAPFESITASWRKQDYEPKENEIPAFPRTEWDEASLRQVINYVEEVFGKVERFFERRVTASMNATDGDVKYFEKELFRVIRMLQVIVLTESDEARAFADRFYHGRLIHFFADLIGLRKGPIPAAFYDVISQPMLDRFTSTIAQLLCSFGNFKLESLYQYILRTNAMIRKQRLYGRMLLATGDREDLINAISQELARDPQAMIRSLRDSIWEDETILPSMYARRPELFVQIVKVITAEFRRHYSAKSVRPYLSHLFRDYGEVLLGIIRLRVNPSFPLLHTGTRHAMLLAKYIRRIDSNLYVHGLHFRTQLRFTLKKPPALEHLSNLAFALNNYLTGELGTNLIQVTGIEHEDEED
jgi:cold shock CspA family protein